ncbi:hypothetical protein BpHYR1_022515 [Brachionus plicatilis]|uniref:Uncharacterized protein n=1 Tax=Brachionus plicatilis TaxID=10195 RepID=A0A3M7R3G4_BRAPC|nr:hypothetical protein BpHYR1_022515 [Brachionus plicatilis]
MAFHFMKTLGKRIFNVGRIRHNWIKSPSYLLLKISAKNIIFDSVIWKFAFFLINYYKYHGLSSFIEMKLKTKSIQNDAFRPIGLLQDLDDRELQFLTIYLL